MTTGLSRRAQTCPGIFIAAAKTTSFVQKHFPEADDGIMMMTCPTKSANRCHGLAVISDIWTVWTYRPAGSLPDWRLEAAMTDSAQIPAQGS
jgi:hypothetical protein